jgi:hypothetical protein
MMSSSLKRDLAQLRETIAYVVKGPRVGAETPNIVWNQSKVIEILEASPMLLTAAENLEQLIQQQERRFPLLGTNGCVTIPWSVAEKAYKGYARIHTQSLETLAERGGFAEEELDKYYPLWRDEVSEIKQLKMRVSELEALLAQEKRDRAMNDAKWIHIGAEIAQQNADYFERAEKAKTALVESQSLCEVLRRALTRLSDPNGMGADGMSDEVIARSNYAEAVLRNLPTLAKNLADQFERGERLLRWLDEFEVEARGKQSDDIQWPFLAMQSFCAKARAAERGVGKEGDAE